MDKRTESEGGGGDADERAQDENEQKVEKKPINSRIGLDEEMKFLLTTVVPVITFLGILYWVVAR